MSLAEILIGQKKEIIHTQMNVSGSDSFKLQNQYSDTYCDKDKIDQSQYNAIKEETEPVTSTMESNLLNTVKVMNKKKFSNPKMNKSTFDIS